MSAMSLPSAGTSTIAQYRFVALHDAVHRMSVAMHTAFTRSADDTVRTPRHHPVPRMSFIEHAAMQREMYRL